MKLSTKGRYAVMAVVDLACHCDEGPVTLADIAGRQDISLSYLEQLFAKMRRADVVKSVRGPGGGYCLSRGAEDTKIADIILAVDEPITATRCGSAPGRGCNKDHSRCMTHDLWSELGRQIHLYLVSVSIADVIERRVFGTAELIGLTGAPSPDAQQPAAQ